MFLEKNNILVTNKFRGESHLYFDISKNSFVRGEPETPSGVYILTVLPMIAARSLKYRPIEGNFMLLTLAAVTLGILSGYIAHSISIYFVKSQSFELIKLSKDEIEEYVDKGKKLQSTQLIFCAILCLLLGYICLAFYFNRTWKYFLGVTISSMLVTILFVFTNYFNKVKVFSIIESKFKLQE